MKTNRLIVVASIALAAIAAIRYEHDRADRASSERFLETYNVGARRPAYAATLAFAPSSDLAANIVADIALSDAVGTIRLDDVSPALREQWLHAVEHFDDELLAARDITLDAAAVRPGWSYHWSLLGQLVYAWQRRHPLSASESDAGLWSESLRVAITEAPGDDRTIAVAASASLDQWPELSDAMRARAPSLFARALHDSTFTSLDFPMILQAVGRERAIALLPDEPRSLRSAFGVFADLHDAPGAMSIYRLWEQAEWRSRVRDLREIEERSQLNDIEKLRDLTISWLAYHPAYDFDTDAGIAQVIRVLQLSVNDRAGFWQADPRAGAVRFLLDHRMMPKKQEHPGIETATGGTAIASATSALSGVPDPIAARVRLFSGDTYAAESLFLRSDTSGSFEWTPFLLDLARFRMTENLIDRAHAALESISPAARKECDALVVQRDLERLAGGNARVDLPTSAQFAADSWSATQHLSLCIDPDLAGHSQLATTIDAEAPALLSYGWNDGRRGVVLMPAGQSVLRVPMSGLWGRNAFFIVTLAGGPAKPSVARVE